jgi:hypothetical protein
MENGKPMIEADERRSWNGVSYDEVIHAINEGLHNSDSARLPIAGASEPPPFSRVRSVTLPMVAMVATVCPPSMSRSAWPHEIPPPPLVVRRAAKAAPLWREPEVRGLTYVALILGAAIALLLVVFAHPSRGVSGASARAASSHEHRSRHVVDTGASPNFVVASVSERARVADIEPGPSSTPAKASDVLTRPKKIKRTKVSDDGLGTTEEPSIADATRVLDRASSWRAIDSE